MSRNLKFTIEMREAYVRTLAQCGKHCLANQVHGISPATVGRAKFDYPGFREQCAEAVKKFNASITDVYQSGGDPVQEDQGKSVRSRHEAGLPPEMTKNGSR